MSIYMVVCVFQAAGLLYEGQPAVVALEPVFHSSQKMAKVADQQQKEEIHRLHKSKAGAKAGEDYTAVLGFQRHNLDLVFDSDEDEHVDITPVSRDNRQANKRREKRGSRRSSDGKQVAPSSADSARKTPPLLVLPSGPQSPKSPGSGHELNLRDDSSLSSVGWPGRKQSSAAPQVPLLGLKGGQVMPLHGPSTAHDNARDSDGFASGDMKGTGGSPGRRARRTATRDLDADEASDTNGGLVEMEVQSHKYTHPA